MNKIHYILYLLLALVWYSCDQNDTPVHIDPQGESVHFRSTQTLQYTRTSKPLVSETDIHIIAPGYGTGAVNQHSIYQTNETGEMSLMIGEEHIRWSARNMYFTAWHPVTPGLTDKNDGTGIVDFEQDLDKLTGAHIQDDYNKESIPTIELEFRHLVAKLTITLENEIATEGIDPNSSITFPAIKKEGVFEYDLTGIPQVKPGKAGHELSLNFSVNDGIGSLTCYLPPLTATELLVYGSFTIKDGNTTYVGTLRNLNLKDDEGKDRGINPGDHITFHIKINDDHTSLLQAVTLAPWNENDKNIYNRPSRGIWGMEDLQALSKIINEDVAEWNNLTLNELVDDKGVIRVFTDIEFDTTDEFAPIGTEANPFERYVFDGNGYTISGFSLKNTAENNQGLFGVVGDSTTIKNVTVKNVLVEGKDNTGVLIGRTIDGSDGILIDHCFTSDSEVMGEENVGGLIGYCTANATVRNCGALTTSVSGNENVGGFSGMNEGEVGNSYAQTKSIICYGTGGGFVGRNLASIRNCYTSASFSYGNENCGAFAGYHQAGGTATYCFWNVECINNTTCSKKVANSTYDNDGLEITPSGFWGLSFNKSDGRIAQTDYRALYDDLNNYIINNPTLTADYLRWAKISKVALPVFGY